MNKPSVSAGVVAGVALGAAALGAAAVAGSRCLSAGRANPQRVGTCETRARRGR